MVHTTLHVFELGDVGWLVSSETRGIQLKNAVSLRFRRRVSGSTIRSRTRQVANGWSAQEREARLRGGNARRAWLLNLVDPPETK